MFNGATQRQFGLVQRNTSEITPDGLVPNYVELELKCHMSNFRLKI